MSTAIADLAPREKDIDRPKPPLTKQKNLREPNTAHLSDLKKSFHDTSKNKTIISSIIFNEKDLNSTSNLNKLINPFQFNLSYSQKNSFYIYDKTNEEANNISNKEKIRLERLNRVNTFEKSLGKNRFIEKDPLNSFPNHISILPSNKSQTIYVPISIPLGL